MRIRRRAAWPRGKEQRSLHPAAAPATSSAKASRRTGFAFLAVLPWCPCATWPGGCGRCSVCYQSRCATAPAARTRPTSSMARSRPRPTSWCGPAKPGCATSSARLRARPCCCWSRAMALGPACMRPLAGRWWCASTRATCCTSPRRCAIAGRRCRCWCAATTTAPPRPRAARTRGATRRRQRPSWPVPPKAWRRWCCRRACRMRAQTSMTWPRMPVCRPWPR